jgi:hypothetical protein
MRSAPSHPSRRFEGSQPQLDLLSEETATNVEAIRRQTIAAYNALTDLADEAERLSP